MLGNLLEQDAFEYLTSTEVRDELRARVGDAGVPEQGVWSMPESLPADAKRMERVGDCSPYAVDPVVRRARALQQTRDANLAEAAVGPELAKSLGVSDGDRVTLSQNDHSVPATLSVDADVPEGCVRVPAGEAISEGLGAAFGDIEVRRS